ncbi:hypothetical protein M8J75_015306 [Diaphorina citri]|nr:hypothetical protein M8J75_015306 [Diaphorina citri]
MNPILFVVAMVLLIYFLSKTMFSRPKHFPPGPSLWFPYYGHFLSILFLHYHHTHKALAKMCRIYKSKILGFYLGPFPTVVASDEKSIRELLMKPQFQGRIDQVVSLVRVDFGEERGIIFTEGDLWQQQKRFFLRHLRDHGFGKRSEPLEVQLAAEIQDLITFLREERNHPAYQNGLALIPSIFAWGNIALLMSALTGEKFTGREGKDALNAIHWNALNFQFYTEPLAGTLTFNSIRKKMDSFNEDTINCAVDAYIKMMKEAQADGDKETYFTEEQLKLVIQDFTFPASNTISGQLGFLWQQFLLHPEVQTKIQEELDRVVGRSELPNLNHRAELHYTEATIREIMRYKTLGTIMIPSLYCLHNDPDIWGDPENFRPERFLDSNGQLKKKDRTLPFGFGKRLCPGETFARQNMFMYVAGLLHNFTFSLPEGAKLPDDSKYIPGLNVHPQHFWMKVTPRS